MRDLGPLSVHRNRLRRPVVATQEAPSHLPLDVLKQLRDETRANGEGIAQTNERVDELRHELTLRLVHAELRAALRGLAGNVHEFASLVRRDDDLRDRVSRCEHDIASIKSRLPA